VAKICFSAYLLAHYLAIFAVSFWAIRQFQLTFMPHHQIFYSLFSRYYAAQPLPNVKMCILRLLCDRG